MLARKIQASAVSMAVSKSLASRRFRLSQASVRSTTHRRGRSWKPFHARGTVDDLQRPAADPLQCALELGPGIGAVGEDVARAGKVAGDGGEHRRRAVAVLDLGAVDHDRDQQAAGVGEDVTLAALDFLSGRRSPGYRRFPWFLRSDCR